MAEKIRDHDWTAIRHAVVAQNTPQWMHRNSPSAVQAPTNPDRWEKVENPADGSTWAKLLCLDAGTDLAVWVKTATLSGRAKVYVKPLGRQLA